MARISSGVIHPLLFRSPETWGPATIMCRCERPVKLQPLIYHDPVKIGAENADTRDGGTGDGPVLASVRLRWVTVTDAARLLGISEVAVRKRLADRSLTGLRAGRSWWVLPAREVAV